MASTQGAERGLKRFEGFTDAVFAIALTLLFLEIKPPGSSDGPPAAADVARAVAEQWRDHLALIVGFLGIGIYWLQHHYIGRLYAKSDHLFSLINLGFLFMVMALLPGRAVGASSRHAWRGGGEPHPRRLAVHAVALLDAEMALREKRRAVDRPPAGARLRTANDAALHDWRVRAGAGAAACARCAKARLGTELRHHRLLDTAAAQAPLPVGARTE